MLKKNNRPLDSFELEYIKEALLVAMESNKFHNTILSELVTKTHFLARKARAKELAKFNKGSYTVRLNEVGKGSIEYVS